MGGMFGGAKMPAAPAAPTPAPAATPPTLADPQIAMQIAQARQRAGAAGQQQDQTKNAGNTNAFAPANTAQKTLLGT